MKINEITISHPNDFFNLKNVPVTPRTCFVLMPFDKKFDIVFDYIVESLDGLMLCDRADDLKVGKQIFERILNGIFTAELIIADLTGMNPNVFYELGIAHTRSKNVLLLTQDVGNVPADIRPLFCHEYKINSKEELYKLSNIVREAAEEIINKRVPDMISNANTRTKQIVEYMKYLIQSKRALNNLMIRIQARLSSLANTRSRDYDEKNMEYFDLLEQERKLIIKLIEKGANLQAIISPLRFSPLSNESDEDRIDRFNTLLKFLKIVQNNINYKCEFVVSPVEGSNLLFFGNEILFEGYKTQVERGFGWTVVHKDKNQINTRIDVFNKLFESSKKYTLDIFGKSSSDISDKIAIRQAVIRAIEQAKETIVI